MLSLRALLCGTLLIASVARADEIDQARRLYDAGQKAYDGRRYQEAYDAFRKAYMLSQKPALLYNMATVLQRLDRPHEAAEALRAYLRTKPDDPDRPAVEERIRTLEETQRMLDEDRARATPPPALVAAPPVAPAPRWTHKKTVITVVATIGGVVMAGALGLGLGLGLRPTPLDSTLGTHQATP